MTNIVFKKENLLLLFYVHHIFPSFLAGFITFFQAFFSSHITFFLKAQGRIASIISRFLQRAIIEVIKNVNEYNEIRYSGYSLIFFIPRSGALAYKDEWIVCF